MNKLAELAKCLVVTGVVFVLGWQFLTVYKAKVRNEALDGCAAQSMYEASYDEGGRRITVREPQRHIYQQCLLDKGILSEENK
jgi:hypothetical protein